MTDLLNAVLDAAREAGSVALKYFRRDITVDIKADGSEVTEADRAAEASAREWIAKRFPGDSIDGEELGQANHRSARRWLVDPIDGTRSFVRGVPLWGSLVAVMQEGRIIAGAAVFPATGEWIAARNGEGCWSNDVRASVSRCAKLNEAFVLTTDSQFSRTTGRADKWSRLTAKAAAARTWGDCYGYHLVATGRAECMTDDAMHEWDWAPFVPIMAEAGGVLTDWSGGTTELSSGSIATNSLLANAIRSELI